MSEVLKQVITANEAYVKGFGDKGKLAMPPARRFAILTCMDARLDPARFAGLSEGDAHVIRNAGGRASDDAIRSLVISYKLLGTREWFVIHHTDCGMLAFTNEVMRELLDHSLETAQLERRQMEGRRKGTGLTRRSFHRVVDDSRPSPKRGGRCGADQGPPFGSETYSCLRVHLRRRDGPPYRGQRGNEYRAA